MLNLRMWAYALRFYAPMWVLGLVAWGWVCAAFGGVWWHGLGIMLGASVYFLPCVMITYAVKLVSEEKW